MHADIAVAFGGRVAEELVFGYDKVSSGASNDIMQASRLARAMVTKWGLSDELGPLDFSDTEESFTGYSMQRGKPMSDETARMIDSEVKRFVEQGLTRARQLLGDHIDQLHVIAQALLEYETLTGEEIKRLIAGETIERDNGPSAGAQPVPAGGTSIPKTRRPTGPFGTPKPLGA
jgi:cell division protease FtsH